MEKLLYNQGLIMLSLASIGVLHKQQAEKQIQLINYFSTAYYIPRYSSGIVLKHFLHF